MNVEDELKKYRIKPGSAVRLEEWDSNDKGRYKGGKEDAREDLVRLSDELDKLQDLLFAGREHRLLVILQAMDTGGKDGTIRSVFNSVDPLGVRVASFKAPSAEERDHDYLWRIHRQTPGKGEIVIFNRSHYEDVLIARVEELVPKKVWKRRYDQINDFERMLAEEGTTILKFYLHISRDEQKLRLQERLDDPSKQWKFNPGDLGARARWDDYMRAYEDVLARTSTEHAPWYVVPANRKWFRNLFVAAAIIATLRGLKMAYPPIEYDPSSITID